MKRIMKIVSLLITISILACYYTSVSAMSVITSDIWVNAGSSAFSSESCFQSSTKTQCYMRMSYIKYNHYPSGNIPTGFYVASRLYMKGYDGNYSYPASNVASFTSTTSVGNYNYSFLTGFGGAGQRFKLKTNSPLNDAYEAVFDWKSEPY